MTLLSDSRGDPMPPTPSVRHIAVNVLRPIALAIALTCACAAHAADETTQEVVEKVLKSK